MLISPSKCPICEEMSVYIGTCEKCWWISPNMLRHQADSYEAFKKFIIAQREGRVTEEKAGEFTIYKIHSSNRKAREGL